MLAAAAFCLGVLCGMMVMAVLSVSRSQGDAGPVMHPHQ